MRWSFGIIAAGILVIALLCAGCANSQPAPAPTPAPTESTATAVPTTAPPFPGALTPGEYVSFGAGDMHGNATVVRYAIRPNYTWTSPSFNSAAEQKSATGPGGVVNGYNTETPKAGDAFLFVYLKLVNTGSKAVYAPSPSQYIVYADGVRYNYTSVHGPDAVVDGVAGGQYDYQIGKGGVGGYIQPGASNAVNGYLIYEVPGSIDPADTYFIADLDSVNRGVWKLS
ncbi:MAG TPA: hypothetical protein VEI81_05700 [Methanoregula sp.]|nr:hypothetical protein [Methanoregula sp.]